MRHLKLRNCWVAKTLMSHTFFVKFRVFKRESFRNHSVCRAQIFIYNWNCYALSVFWGFILLTSSDNDKDSPISDNRKAAVQAAYFPIKYSCRNVPLL